MLKPKPVLYIFGGPNGAGKTTFARALLNEIRPLPRFLNADEIARGLSPLQPAAVAVQAGRLLLTEFKRLIATGESFSIESTLSGRTYIREFRIARACGYNIELHYLHLESVKLALARIHERVLKGGHSVPSSDVIRRYSRSLGRLVADYLPLADRWAVWDNTGVKPIRVADHLSCTITDVKTMLIP